MRKVQKHPRTVKELVKLSEVTGTKVSTSTVLYRHNLNRLLPEEEATPRKPAWKRKTNVADEHCDKNCDNLFWSDETKIQLFGHNDALEEEGVRRVT